jgi:hypothetical protein
VCSIFFRVTPPYTYHTSTSRPSPFLSRLNPENACF